MPVPPLDYARSFLRWTRSPRQDARDPGHMPWGNSVRILLDARALVTDGSGAQQEFVLIAPCRTEWTYQPEILFQRSAGEYRVAWSSTHALPVNRRRDDVSERRASRHTDRLDRVAPDLQLLADPRELQDDDAVVEAAQSTAPIVAQTELRDASTGRTALLEYPIRTLNYLDDRNRFQVDTGPMLWVDLGAEVSEPIDWLHLAHIAYNRFDAAEFATLSPTPVERRGDVVAEVDDYSTFHRQDAVHALFAGG